MAGFLKAMGKGLKTQKPSWRLSTESSRKERDSPDIHSMRKKNTNQMRFFLFHFWAFL